MDPDQYCRDLEAHLCRKNDGHLIRIVGPSFERVRGWAAQGIPIKVAMRGVDRYFERYYAKGPRRRPVRIEFCEADVLDVFDEWRRAVGIMGLPAPDQEGEAGERTSGSESPDRQRGPSLPSHLERVVARLTILRARQDLPEAVRTVADRLVRELDAERASARHLRGDARAQMIDRLRAGDRELIEAAERALDDPTREAIERDAAGELAAFRSRMTHEVFAGALEAGRRRLVRQQLGLPQIAL